MCSSDLMDSIFGLLLCVFLICHKEAVVAISDHLEKVCRSNLFEFSVSGIIGKFQLNKALVFSQQSFAKIFMWLVVTSYYTPPLWSLSLQGWKTIGEILIGHLKNVLISN